MWGLTDPLRPVLGRFYRVVGSDLMLRLQRRRLLLGQGSGPAQADPELPGFDPGGAEAPEQRHPADPVRPLRASPQRFFARPGSPVLVGRRPATAAAPAPGASPAQIRSALTPASLRAAGAGAGQAPLWPPAASRGEAAAGPAPPQTQNHTQAAIAAPIGGQGPSGPAPADPSTHRQEPVAAPPGVEAAAGPAPADPSTHRQEPVAAPLGAEAAPGLMPGSPVQRSQAAIGGPAASGAEAAPGLMPGGAVRRSESIGAPAATRAEAAPGLMLGDPSPTGQAVLSSPGAAHASAAAAAPLPARAEAPLLRLTRAAAQRWQRRTTLQATAGSLLSTGELVVPAAPAGSPVVPRAPTGRGTPVAAPGAPPAQARSPAPSFTSQPRWSGAPEPAVAGGPGTAALRLPDAALPPLPGGGSAFDEAAGGDDFLFEERVRRVLDRILRTDALRHGLTLGER